MMRRVLLIASLTMATFLVFAGTASAQSYAGFTVTASTTNVTPGETITLSGSGARANCALSAVVNGVQIGSGTAGATGAFTFTVTVPTDAAGSVPVTVSCNG